MRCRSLAKNFATESANLSPNIVRVVSGRRLAPVRYLINWPKISFPLTLQTGRSGNLKRLTGKISLVHTRGTRVIGSMVFHWRALLARRPEQTFRRTFRRTGEAQRHFRLGHLPSSCVRDGKEIFDGTSNMHKHTRMWRCSNRPSPTGSQQTAQRISTTTNLTVSCSVYLQSCAGRSTSS